MSKYYSRYNRKDNNYNNRKYNQYNHKTKNYHKKKQNNNNDYYLYNKKNYNTYDIYEEEISIDKETTVSTEAPSIKDDSFSQNSNSTSRKHSICEYNNDNSDNFSLIIFDDNSIEKPKIDNIPKINLSDNEIQTAYFKPKKYKETSLVKNETNNENKNDNINILEINVKISKEKKIEFKLKKYDDMFQVAQEACKKNGLSEDYVNFFVYTIIKALNSIYGIYNLKLKEEEINTLKHLKEKCNSD